ncbi:tyrosine-type recombinase/integrase [Prescottella equi]|uniref:tyrosine-type recombinase/integrase n=1 Tax=Rhodococcus hoagii TaxID=43767 RepID=UPI0023DC6CB2|nr:tyrosine-type recombinase/integrase [Prescottella equi]
MAEEMGKTLTTGPRDSNQIEAVPDVSAGLDDYTAAVREATRSPRTLQTYKSAWQHFAVWCSTHGHSALPASEQTLLSYLLYWGHPDFPRRPSDSLLSRSTARTYLRAIKWFHLQNRAPWPTYGLGEPDRLRETLRLIEHARRDDTRRPKGTAIAEAKMLAAVRSISPNSPQGARDRSLLLTTFYGAFRREEVVRLRVEDLVFSEDEHMEGMLLRLRSSKTDRHGAGQSLAISKTWITPCPVVEMKRWLSIRGSEQGPIFTNVGNRGPRTTHGQGLDPTHVNRTLKRAIEAIGEDPSKYSAHSLRSGLITSAARLGVEPRLIKMQSRHATYEMLERYIHDVNSLSNNVVRAMHPR